MGSPSRFALGNTSAQIAAAWVIEVSTVKSHVTWVLTKLGVRNRVQAVIAAYEQGVGRTPGGRPS